ncbi:MAG: tRNA uridine-5-carboxymethylaminomethyl(34) synthesis GTPase MnmE [PS1 clade bacterium]|jgi:tRNA modification GTPase
MSSVDTICAIASGIGQAGVGVIRVSGPLALRIAKKMLGYKPKPRFAHYGSFINKDSEVIDKGVALFFPAPNSFTGEDVFEIQGHGGSEVMRSLLDTAIVNGAIVANPGDFSKRAFLNGKMDLVQAEAIADLISANSKQSARSALRSLSGEFSKQVNLLTKLITELRVFVEATIDFSEEEIDFLESSQVNDRLINIEKEIASILATAKKGAILREGLFIVIAGKPNAGKSSLLNALTLQSSAIVTDEAGTTRDVLRETIHINGAPLNIIDTAGLHLSDNKIEKEGIKRAHVEIEKADLVIVVFDAQDIKADLSILPTGVQDKPILLVKNKVDLTNEPIAKTQELGQVQLALSAKDGTGIDLLRKELERISGLNDLGENVVLARKRHIIALELALTYTKNAIEQLNNGASELLAEDLRQAGIQLGSITGEFSSDDLLGEIFSSFCIGK